MNASLINENRASLSVRGLTEGELLSVWECGIRLSPAGRAELILETVAGNVPEATTLGDRDCALMKIYENTFGSVIELADTCLSCGEVFEYTLDLQVIQNSSVRVGESSFAVSFDSWEAECRLPLMVDIGKCLDTGEAGTGLAVRCITSIKSGGASAPFHSVPEELLAKIEKRILELDPAVEISLELPCPSCAHSQISFFDITDLLWKKVTAGAQLVASNVHTLATAYGWTEENILGMSSSRRQLYLSIVGAV